MVFQWSIDPRFASQSGKRSVIFFYFLFNWGDAPSLSRRAPNEGAKSIPKDHVIDLCDINASLLPRPGIEPGPAAWQARTLALHHVSGLLRAVIYCHAINSPGIDFYFLTPKMSVGMSPKHDSSKPLKSVNQIRLFLLFYYKCQF